MHSLFFKNYMAMIENSVGTRMFQNYFAEVDNQTRDVLEDGRLSCAVWVSSVLILKNLIEGPPRGPHAMVKSLIKNLEDSGWEKIKKPRTGAVLIWEPAQVGKKVTDHIGFYLGTRKHLAISNTYGPNTPHTHHWTYGKNKNGKARRKVTAIYWHDKLG